MFLNSIQPDANVHSFCKLQIAGLIAKKTLMKVFSKYVDFANIFPQIWYLNFLSILESTIMILNKLMADNHFMNLFIA